MRAPAFLFAILLMGLSALTTGRAACAAPVQAAAGGLSTAVASVCQPTFRVDGIARTTGTAFLVATRASGQPVLAITAHHLLGLATGPLPWAAAPVHVADAKCPMLDESTRFDFGTAFAIRGAHMLGDLKTLNDIAVFPLRRSGSAALPAPLELADQEPHLGQAVWLVARTKGQARDANFLHRARIVSDGGYLGYVFDEPGLNTADTSGAPIVDVGGHVVGVNVGAGHLASGGVFGVADTLPTIRAALSQALAQAPPWARRSPRR